jgi:hypothetical protein
VVRGNSYASYLQYLRSIHLKTKGENMAVKYWLGGNSGNETVWNVAANWNGGLPAAGDEIYIDDRAGLDTNGKRWSILNFAGAVTDLLLFHVKSSYDGNIGDGGTNWLPARSERNNGEFVFEGSGNCYVKPGTSGHFINRLVAKGASSSLLTIATVAGAYISDLDCSSGTVVIADSTRVDNLRVADNCTLSGGKAIAANAVNTPILQTGGVITWQSNIANVDVAGGTFNWGATSDTTLGGQRRGTGTVRIYRGGRFNWQAKDGDATAPANTSILKRFIVYPGGILDASGTTNRDAKKQIGSAASAPYDISEVWPGAQALFDNGTNNISFLNASTKIRNRGGVIQVPSRVDTAW